VASTAAVTTTLPTPRRQQNGDSDGSDGSDGSASAAAGGYGGCAGRRRRQRAHLAPNLPVQLCTHDAQQRGRAHSARRYGSCVGWQRAKLTYAT
jgi:hypothetical protein